MIEIKINGYGEQGIFARQDITKDSLLFSYNDWIRDEQTGWITLTPEEITRLPLEQKNLFLRYGYDTEFGSIIGPTNINHVLHISNFMNHSCDPNMQYDYDDNIIAKRDIKTGEELNIDYGTFIVNVDQDFVCSCGSANCRGQIKKNDWQILIQTYGDHFPRFIQKKIHQMISANQFNIKPGKPIPSFA